MRYWILTAVSPGPVDAQGSQTQVVSEPMHLLLAETQLEAQNQAFAFGYQPTAEKHFVLVPLDEAPDSLVGKLMKKMLASGSEISAPVYW